VESGRESGELKSAINVTPLVDVMLVLLIIFMLVTPFLQEGIPVDLPKARNVAGVTDDRDRVLTVVIKVNGDAFIGKERVDGAHLAQVLIQEYDTNPALELHVKADRNVRFGMVRQAVKAGREAGFRTTALVAEEPEP